MEKINLNENQLKAVKHKSGPLLVVAGAGTGKTRVITERVKHLIENEKIKPQEVLALTFTEKASQEMLNRIGDVMPLGYEEPWVSTFHGFADRILKTEGLEIGLDPSYKILPTSDQWLLLRKNLFNLDLKYFRPLGNPTKFISAILKFISRLQDENISVKELKSYVKSLKITGEEKQRWEELSHIYEKYEEIKLKNSALDFGDLIDWTIKLFTDRPNILEKYQDQFKHVLVDEFQDTNYAQYELIKLLCPEKMGNRSLMVVGDDSQSIYKFRGAAVSNILQFKKDFKGAEMITLLENYRSSQEILDPAYKLIKNNNPDTLESKLGISKELVSQIKEKGGETKVIKVDTLDDEIEYILRKIYEILGKEERYTYKDIAIMARANNHLDPFVMGLRKYGLPYQLVGNRGLYDADEISDIISLLKVLTNSSDGTSLYRVLSIDSLEIPYSEISKLLSNARKQRVDLWEMGKTSKDERVQNLVNIIESFQDKITKLTPTELTHSLVHDIKYLEPLLENETTENILKIQNLNLFLRKVQNFEVNYHSEYKQMPTIIDFVEYLDLVIEAGENPAQAEIEDIDTINLITVHSSKGLEFPVVFMVNLVSGRFPTRNRGDPIEVPDELIKETLPTGDEHTQEERRLFYVGMTRSKKYLYLTYAENYGGKRDTTPSGYLKETGIKTEKVKPDTEKQVSLFEIQKTPKKTPKKTSQGFEPAYLSYSQIDNYLICPLRYKYGYVLNVPTAPSHPLSFGNTIHETLKRFHTQQMFGKEVSLKKLLEIYEENWIPVGYLDEKHKKLRFESGKKLLENYYDENKDLKVKYVALEKSFNLKIDGIKMYGRIDRIDKHPNGDIEIIDYKTGSLKTQKDVDKDAQMTIYALACKEALNLDPKILSFYYVEAGEKVSTERTEKHFKGIKGKIKDVIKNIKEGKFEPTPGMHCKWCDFNQVCPFAQKS